MFPVGRPLCLLALVFAASLFMIGRIHPPDLKTLRWARTGLDGEEVTINATASEKEFHRSSDGTLSLYLTASQVSFTNEKGKTPPDPEERVLIVLSGETEYGLKSCGSGGPGSLAASVQAVESEKTGGSVKFIQTNGSKESGIPDICARVVESEGSAVSLQKRSPDEYDRLIQIGDRIRVRGTCRTFEEPRNPGGFNSALYYEIQNISFKITSADVLLADSSHHTIRDSFYNIIYGIRRRLEKAIEEIYPLEEESIIKAMLLGENGQLDGEIKTLYQSAGIIHILSVSGLHISLLGTALLHLLKRLRIPPPAAAAVSSCVIFCYVVMTGLSPSSLRALFMFSLRITADALHRTYDLLNATAVAACLLLADEPLYLYHSGFLFSFSAILSIAIILPACKGKIMKAAAVPLGTLPVYLHFYYTFPLYSLLLNLVVIPLVTIVMYSAALSSIAWFILPLLGKMASLPAIGVLTFYKLLCEAVRRLPFYTLNLGCPQAGQTAAYYALIGIWLFLNHQSCKKEEVKVQIVSRRRGRLFPGTHHKGNGYRKTIWKLTDCFSQRASEKFPDMCGFDMPGNSAQNDGTFERLAGRLCGKRLAQTAKNLVLLFAVLVITLRFHNDELRIDFLDVGQGDGICIEKGDTDILIDGGSSSSQNVGKYVLQPYFQSYGLSDIDCAVLTHDDIDHCSGMIELLENMPEGGVSIRKLLLPDVADSLKGDHYRMLEKLAAEKGVAIEYISRGDRLTLGREEGVTIECLYPAQDVRTENANEASLVLFLRYDNFSALLTGDLEKEGEEQCLEWMKGDDLREELPSGELTVLKVGHHGSKNATREEFLDYLDPKAAVISCGRHNLYGHPSQETLERLKDAGCAVYRTDEHGMIRVTTDGSSCRIQEYMSEEQMDGSK